jgi:hypothetical protein
MAAHPSPVFYTSHYLRHEIIQVLTLCSSQCGVNSSLRIYSADIWSGMR